MYSNKSRAIQEEIMRQLQEQQRIAEYRQNQKQQYTNPLNIANRLNGISKGIYNTGSKLQKAGNFLQTRSNSMLNTIGNKMGTMGSNLQNLSLRPQIGNMLGGVSSAVPTTASTGAIGSTIGTGTSVLPSTIGAMGTGAGAGIGAGLGAGAGTTAAGTGAIGSAIGSAAPAATSIAGGAGAAGAAGGALAAGSMAIPVAGAVVAAALLAKGIKDKIDAAHKKVNAKAMQADANTIGATENQVNQNKQGIMNDLMQQSTQDAQSMTLPDTTQPEVNSVLSQEIMQQAYPNYSNTASNLNDNSSLGINTPNTIETPQITPSPLTQNEGSDIASMINNYVTDNPQTDNALTNAINTAQPNPAVEETKTGIIDKLRNAFGDFKAGYDDNSLHGFSEGDLANKLAGGNTEEGEATGGAAPLKKSIMNRLGEAAGTGRRLMANPWVQAGIAGGISKAAGGDIDDIAKAAYQYGTAKSLSDQYYRMMNPDAKVMPVFNTYGANDYRAKAYNDFNQGRTMMSRRDYIKLSNPTWGDEQVEQYLNTNGLNGDEVLSLKGYEAINKVNAKNRDLDIKEDSNTWKKDQGQQKINNQKVYQTGQLDLGRQRVGVQQQNANTNSARLAETKSNNKRNYELKANKQNVKNAEEELKARGYKKVNGKWVK